MFFDLTEIFLKRFIKNYDDVRNPEIREKYGILSSAVGIIINIMLSLSKFIIGTISHSISITGDAVNNLADVGSCFVTLFAFKMATRKPDKEHPFGHGRIEYIAALIVGIIVELMGFELLKSSTNKIIHPQPVVFSPVSAVVIVISIFAKLYLALFNKDLGKRISSPALAASVKDSISDITSTSITLVSLIFSAFVSLPLDGILGVIVSFFIMYSGYGVLKESIGIILGAPPSKEFVDDLLGYIKNFEGVLGIHDLVIHSYGENHLFGSAHIEVAENMGLVQAHDIADNIEAMVFKKFKMQLVAHIDPIVTSNENYDYLNCMIKDILSQIDETVSYHDFRIVEGPTHTNLVFDTVIPFDFKLSAKELSAVIQSEVSKRNPTYFVVTTIEYNYI